jgi:hypothetical protein
MTTTVRTASENIDFQNLVVLLDKNLKKILLLRFYFN